jgi:N6-adenosine-specific RNA methylase IME4
MSVRPIPLGRSYGAVLADPPWRFKLYSELGEEKSAQAQYDCMDMAALKRFGREINLDFLCAPDCGLVMWGTFPMLPEAIDLLAEWGFRYTSGGAWAKSDGETSDFGAGYWYRSAAEFWLLGLRGHPAIRSRSERNLILARRGKHSEKPDDLHRQIERQFKGPYLELFARRPRPGWDCYGNEVGGFVEYSSVAA